MNPHLDRYFVIMDGCIVVVVLKKDIEEDIKDSQKRRHVKNARTNRTIVKIKPAMYG